MNSLIIYDEHKRENFNDPYKKKLNKKLQSLNNIKLKRSNAFYNKYVFKN